MNTARPEIQSGRTIWVLTVDGGSYVPQTAPPASAGVNPALLKWRHHLDKQSGKVYFSNTAGAVEWKLPDIVTDTADNSEISALTRPASDQAATASAGAGSAVESAASSRQRVLDKIQERLRSSRSPSPAVLSGAPIDKPAAAPTAAGATALAPTATTVEPAPMPGSHTPVSNNSLAAAQSFNSQASDSTAAPIAGGGAGTGAAGGGGGASTDASYWKERLQRHRSRTLSPMTQRSPSNPTVSPLAPSAPQDFQRSSRLATAAATDAGAVSPSPANPGPSSPAGQVELQPGETVVALAPPLDRAALEERKRQMIAADASLQMERAEVIRMERIALDRQRIAANELARQEEEHAAIAARRKELELRRQELEQASLRELEAKRMEALARAAAAAAGLASEDGVAGQKPDEEMQVALHGMQHSADARIRASHEFASALSLAMLQDLQSEVPEPAATEELTKAVAGLKQATVAYDATHRYAGTMRGKQKHGKGKYTLHKDDQFFYDGDWAADKKHGSGVASLPHVMYEGEWRNDKPSGQGLLHTQRMQTSATFSNGVAHGNVVAQLASGESFGGKFKSNSVTSPGALTLSAGDRVEWRSADPSRPGTGSALVAYTSGDSYSGSIADWKLHGEGQYYFADTKDTYVGTFTRGEFTGEGTYTFAQDASVYQGTVVRGAFHGKGKYATADAVYDGEWVEGRMHGKGTITYANGDVWKGTFENDRRAKGKYIFSKSFVLA